jgi:hypothetical protein
VFWNRRKDAGAKPGALIFTFQSLAPRLQSPQDMKARVAFYDLVKEAWDYHGVQSYEALPLSTLRDLELLLVLVHRNIPQFEEEMMNAGVAARALVDAQREALTRPELVQRSQVSQQSVSANQDTWQQNLVEVAPNDLVAWLATQPANVWHEVAVNYNWDLDAPRDLGWIIDQPFCDLATAMHVFLYGAPEFYDAYKTAAEVPEHARPVFELVDRVAQRIIEGAYPMRRFAVDGDALAQRQAYQRKQLASGGLIHWVLPDEAFGPFERRPTNSPFLYHDGEISRRPAAH